ncbi:YafY family protein [Leucobacter sp. BZR 635]
MARTMLASDRVVLLLSLVPYLREHGPTPIAELAETFEVDPDMLRGLIRFLGTAGIPGETLSYQHNDLFDIDWDEFEERDTVSLTQTVAIEETPRFTGVETAALLAGLAALQPLLSPADAALAAQLGERLGAAMGTAGLPAVAVSASDRNGTLAALVGAIEARRAVRFGYRAADGSESVRTVHPASLTEREGVWYLFGYSVERAADRTFAVAQISGLEILETAGGNEAASGDSAAGGDAAPGKGTAPSEAGASGKAAVPSEDAAPGDAAARGGTVSSDLVSREMLAVVPKRLLGAIRGFAPEEVSDPTVQVAPGSVLVRIEAWHAGAAVRLAQHGPGEIEIVAPPAARAAVSEWAEAALAAYGE